MHSLSYYSILVTHTHKHTHHKQSNGYRSIHDGVYLMDGGGTAEIQIRTEAMHYEAEEGVASHALYKAELQTVDQVEEFQQQLGGSGTYGNGRGGWATTSTTKVMKQTLLLPSVAGSTAGAAGGSAASAAAPEP